MLREVVTILMLCGVVACEVTPSIESAIVHLSPAANGYVAQIDGQTVDPRELDEAVLASLMAANPGLTAAELRREATVFVFPNDGVSQEETIDAVESLRAFERVAFVAEDRR